MKSDGPADVRGAGDKDLAGHYLIDASDVVDDADGSCYNSCSSGKAFNIGRYQSRWAVAHEDVRASRGISEPGVGIEPADDEVRETRIRIIFGERSFARGDEFQRGPVALKEREHLGITQHEDVVAQSIQRACLKDVFAEDAEYADAFAADIFAESIGMDELRNLFVDPLALGRILRLELGQRFFVGCLLAGLHLVQRRAAGLHVGKQCVRK